MAVEFPALGPGVYLNAASVTPLPRRTLAALRAADEKREAILSLTDEELLQALSASRSAAAALIGASPEEIALGTNTSFGLNVAARSLPRRPGKILVSDREFPANVYPWMAREGEELEIVPTDPHGRPDDERLRDRLRSGEISVFAVSSVQFATGHRADLEAFGRICREQGTHFVVDAIQSLGQIPLDVRAANVDLLASGGHKWLCGPFGTGFLYVRRELIDRLEPPTVGWTGMAASGDIESLLDYRWEFRSDARRFEQGTLPFGLFAGFAASLSLLLQIGIDQVERHDLEILEPLVNWLRDAPEVETISSLDPAHRSAILCFRPPSAPQVYTRLRAAGVVGALREGAIRFAAHLYNRRDEIERVVELLEEIRQRNWS